MFSILDTYLDNGLRVLLRKIPNQKTLSCGIWINQGVKDEDVTENGISHLLEHMMFKTNSASSTLGIEEHIQTLGEIGARFNATTTKDFTSFYIDGLSRDTKEILKILSYIVTNKTNVNEGKLEVEKEIVLREAEGYLASSKQIAERLGQALWGDISYGQLVIGKPEMIKNISSKQLDELIAKSYIPENSVLVIVGGFDYDDVLGYVEEIWGNWQDRHKLAKNYVTLENPGVYINSSFGGDRSTVSIGFKTFPFNDYRTNYVELLKDIFVGTNSRIFNRIREEKALVYSINGFTTVLTLSGILGMAFSANNKDLFEIVEICTSEIKNLLENGVNPNDLEKVKRIKETQWLLELESTSNQLQTIGRSAIKGKTFSVEDHLRDLKKASCNTLNKVVEEIFIPENISMALLGNAEVDNILSLLDI